MARIARTPQRSKRDRFITDRLVDRAVQAHLAQERIARQQQEERTWGWFSAVPGEVGPSGDIVLA